MSRPRDLDSDTARHGRIVYASDGAWLWAMVAQAALCLMIRDLWPEGWEILCIEVRDWQEQARHR